MNYPWLRILKIRLFSTMTGREFVFGGTGSNFLNIQCKVNKYLCATKDSAEIRISNLTYSQICEIITGKFYDVEIYAGYQNRQNSVCRIFKGGVLYVSNELGDHKTNEVIILCASTLIAKFGQAKLSISLNSGINLYSAINFILRRAGIDESYIVNNDETIRKIKMDYDKSLKNSSIQSYLDYLQSAYDEVNVAVDSIRDSTVAITSSTFNSENVYMLDNNLINLASGYPRLTDAGLVLTTVPVLDCMCGENIKIDNSLIDISVSSLSEVQKSYGNYIDKNGLYKIFEMQYNLANRSSEFSLNLTCKSKSMLEG